LNIVVLPAPFGPISAEMLLLGTLRLTFDSAANPPKRRDTAAQFKMMAPLTVVT
jgi:hypothetical protein